MRMRTKAIAVGLALVAAAAGVKVWNDGRSAPASADGQAVANPDRSIAAIFKPAREKCEQLARDRMELDSNGRGVWRVDGEAAKAPCLAATRRDPSDGASFYRLGRAYEAMKQAPEAVDAYQRADELGHATASLALGLMYLKGADGVPADKGRADAPMRRAVKQYLDAAEAGVPAALLFVGLDSLGTREARIRASDIYRLGIHEKLDRAAAGGYAMEVMLYAHNLQPRRQDSPSAEEVNATYLADILNEIASKHGDPLASLALAEKHIWWADRYDRMGMDEDIQGELDAAKSYAERAKTKGDAKVIELADKYLDGIRNYQTRDQRALAALGALLGAAVSNLASSPGSLPEASYTYDPDAQGGSTCQDAQEAAAWGAGSVEAVAGSCL